MDAFITGATGFIGRRLAKELVKRGWKVSALVRKESHAEDLHRLGVRCATGDLRDRDSIQRAYQRETIVFHLATVREGRSVRKTVFQEINVGGTENLLDAIGSCPDRLVYVRARK